MKLAPKALYNSLRMSAPHDTAFDAKSWQIEEYREIALDELFLRLNKYQISFDRQAFIAYANEYDSPEELFEAIIELEEWGEDADEVYLLLFELWRRLVPEKQSVSLICDELDHQIFFYDNGLTNRREPLDDALSSFANLVQENLDNDPQVAADEVFEVISQYCANDIPSFLYDYISELIDKQETSYAAELLEQFFQYMGESYWFEFLQARLIALENMRHASQYIRELFERSQKEQDLEFHLEILTYLARKVDMEFFREVLTKAIPLIDSEEDIGELLHISQELFTNLGRQDIAQELTNLIPDKNAPSALLRYFE